VFLLHTTDDSFAIHRFLTERSPRTAVLVGAGYIGLERADALIQRGLEVTLLCRADTVLPTVDPALGRLVQEELRRHGVRVLTGVSAAEINQTAIERLSRVSVLDSAGARHEADLVLLAAGARPDSELAEHAGAKLGSAQSLSQDRYAHEPPQHARTSFPAQHRVIVCVHATLPIVQFEQAVRLVWLPPRTS
jgi:pyruvate/2-oxoglutarate dehydrogenase complex dihydrolipoamide dehydrogenase (E3) component